MDISITSGQMDVGMEAPIVYFIDIGILHEKATLLEAERKVDGMRSRGKINPIFKVTVCFVIHKAFEHTVL